MIGRRAGDERKTRRRGAEGSSLCSVECRLMLWLIPKEGTKIGRRAGDERKASRRGEGSEQETSGRQVGDEQKGNRRCVAFLCNEQQPKFRASS